jgi:hypothetical protein
MEWGDVTQKKSYNLAVGQIVVEKKYVSSTRAK